MSSLQADRAEIAAFVSAIFTYADEGTFISLRSFDQFDRNVPAFMIEGVRVNGRTDRIVDRAHAAAQRSADHAQSTVFAPPICTFKQSWGAKGTDLANGVALSLELDEAPGTARIRMEGLLGPATLVVASGSDWIDPATGEIEPKLHLHWRLSEPTRADVDHAKLRAARTAAALLVGGDPTGKPIVHPYRWAGSWNTKAQPRLCRIVESNQAAEIHLSEALDVVQGAVEAAGLASVDIPISSDPHAAPERIRSAMAAIHNPGTEVHYSDWIDFGYAVANSTNGAGFDIWDTWSQKSDKYDAGETEAAWRRILSAIRATDAPVKRGAGSIIMHAKNAGWRWRPEPPEQEEPPPHLGYDGHRCEPPDFDAPPPECDEGSEADRVVAEFNGRYMVVNESGKALVYASAYDPVLKRQHYDRTTFDDFRKLHMNRIIEAGRDDKDRPVLKSVATVWLSSPRRKQFIGGIAFDPSGNASAPDVLNLWRGFAVTAAPGDWSLLRQHIGTVLCGGDRALFNYVIGWMARLVQHPAEQGEVAIVMKGPEGSGKGTLARALLRIFGQHGLAISNAKHLTGNFNGHLRDVVLLFADEAFYAGDRQHTGVLKSIITEPHLTIEAKFANAEQQPNFLHLMMASNDEWVIPASLEARRFCVLEAGAERMGDHAYFAAIWQQMEAGGYEAMLDDLLTLDLTTFNVRNVPQTVGLENQRKLSLPIPEAWWRDCLERGYVFRSKLGLEDVFGKWHDTMSTELLFASYGEFADRHRERRPLTREAIGTFMRRMKAKPSRPRNKPVGEHLTDEADHGGSMRRMAKAVIGDNPPSYALGSLADARAGFIVATGLVVVWEPAVDHE